MLIGTPSRDALGAATEVGGRPVTGDLCAPSAPGTTCRPWSGCVAHGPRHRLDLHAASATLHTPHGVRRHCDNLWSLGGELIRCRYDDDDRAKKDVRDALQQLIEGDGGPLMWPRITEAEQDSLDATCRKLNRFMHDSAAARKAG